MAEQEIPGFWADPALEPKRNFRWILNIEGVEEWVIKKVNKPTITITEAKHEFLIHTFYYPGRVTFNDVKITLADPIQPDSAARMMQILETSGYNFPDTAEELRTISKANSTAALGEVTLRQINAAGEDIEVWTLTNAWVKEVNFGDLAYDSDDLVNIELTLKYDFATRRTET